MKKSFILYLDQEEIVDQLTDAQAGKIFKALFDHSRGETPIVSQNLKPTFTAIRQVVDRSNIRYEMKCEANRKNIQKRWSKSKNSIRNEAKKYEPIPSDTKPYLKDKDKDKDIRYTTIENNGNPSLKEKSPQLPTAKELPKDFFDNAMDLAEKLSAKKIEEERRAK